MKTFIYNRLAIIITFLISLHINSQKKETEGYILFPKCKFLNVQDMKICNTQELNKFILRHVKYTDLEAKNKYEGKLLIEYVLHTNGKLESHIIDDNNASDLSVKNIAISIMNNLTDSIKLGLIQTIPSKIRNKVVKTYFRIPIIFNLQNNQGKKKIVLATYRTSEKTIQFRKDLKDNFYIYSLWGGKEELLTSINSNIPEEELSINDCSYLFLYNLTFLKSMILITYGEINGKKYDIFIDKNTYEDSTNEKDEILINVYSSENPQKLIEVIKGFNALFTSKYAVLLFK